MLKVRNPNGQFHSSMLIFALLSFGALASGETPALGNVNSTSVPSPEPITKPALSSSTTETGSEATTLSPKTSILTTILQPRRPTILQEVSSEFTRKGRSRFQDPRRANNNQLRDRNVGQMIRRLIRAGKRMIARSLSLITGDPLEDGSLENLPTTSVSSSMEQLGITGDDGGGSSLSSRLTDIDPIQLLMSGFNNKRNKMQRFREIKDEFRKKELERRVALFDDMSGDLLTRKIRNLLWILVNKYEKGTDMVQLWANYRRASLKTFLEIPIVSNLLSGRGSSNNNSSPSDNFSSQEYSFDTPSSAPLDLEPSSQEDVAEPDGQLRSFSSFNPASLMSRKFMRLLNFSF